MRKEKPSLDEEKTDNTTTTRVSKQTSRDHHRRTPVLSKFQNGITTMPSPQATSTGCTARIARDLQSIRSTKLFLRPMMRLRLVSPPALTHSQRSVPLERTPDVSPRRRVHGKMRSSEFCMPGSSGSPSPSKKTFFHNCHSRRARDCNELSCKDPSPKHPELERPQNENTTCCFL